MHVYKMYVCMTARAEGRKDLEMEVDIDVDTGHRTQA